MDCDACASSREPTRDGDVRGAMRCNAMQVLHEVECKNQKLLRAIKVLLEFEQKPGLGNGAQESWSYR